MANNWALGSARGPLILPFCRTRSETRAPSSSSTSRDIVVNAEASPTVNSQNLTAEELFEKARFVLQNTGYYAPFTQEGEDMLDEDFVFRGPAVGPLPKKSYIKQLKFFSVYKAFPDISANAWGFSIDPLDPLRVWFMVRETGTMTQPWAFGKIGPEIAATGKPIEAGPSTYSMIFTAEGKLKYLSIGYIADRIVSPAPNGSPLVAVPALMRAADIESAGAVIMNARMANVVRSVSSALGPILGDDSLVTPKYEELPQWFRDLPNGKIRGADGM